MGNQSYFNMKISTRIGNNGWIVKKNGIMQV
jgi:hypothetical protein